MSCRVDRVEVPYGELMSEIDGFVTVANPDHVVLSATAWGPIGTGIYLYAGFLKEGMTEGFMKFKGIKKPDRCVTGTEAGIHFVVAYWKI